MRLQSYLWLAIMVIGLGFSLVGTAMVLAALFARALGLDSNTAWGASRYFLLLVGLVLLTLGLYRLFQPRLNAWTRKQLTLVRDSAPYQLAARFVETVRGGKDRVFGWWRRSTAGMIWRRFWRWLVGLPLVSFLAGSSSQAAFLFAGVVLVIGIAYFYWLVTLGRWGELPQLSGHFDILAQGIAKGQLHLPLQPSPELLAAQNPYALEARQYMPPLWDISYYQEKFYLYWGPVPALAALLARQVFNIAADDTLLTFSFVVGTALLGGATILQLRRRLFPNLPGWIVVPPLSVLIFSIPLPWLLSRPAVYEAAIASAQFFLIGGLWLLLPQFAGQDIPTWRLALGSLALGLTVASRVNLLPAAGFLLLAALALQLLRDGGLMRSRWPRYTAVLLPFLGVGVLLLAYNYGRFGSVLEFGHRYQLGRWNKYDNYAPVLNLGNLIPNIYNYLFNPPTFLNIFPYLKPGWGEYYIWPAHYYAPEDYHTEKLTGLLVGIPYLWLIWGAIGSVATGLKEGVSAGSLWKLVENNIQLVSLMLLATALLALAPLLFFVSASMRHLTDVVPLAVLLATIGFWAAYSHRRENTNRSRWLLGAVWLLALASVLVGMLLAFTGFDARFERANPELFRQLTRWFTP